MKAETYYWSTYYNGSMTAYISDPEHVPPQWQENLTGKRKADAIAVIEGDIAACGNDPTKYEDGWISEPAGIAWRTSKASGNTWEVLTDSIKPRPEPPTPAPPPAETRTVQIAKGTCTIVSNNGRLLIVIAGESA